jgi:hypothetical protein
MSLRPLARLRDIFPIELQERNKRQLMNAPLELRINSKHRIVLSQLQDDEVLLEVETPMQMRDGHGWFTQSQLRLNYEQICEMNSYLMNVVGEVLEERIRRSGTDG